MTAAIIVTDPPFSAPIGGRSNVGPDALAAIQAAIDYAITNGIGTVFIPGGDYRLSAPLFMDHPLNLRVSKTTRPNTSSFSLRLIGPGARLWWDAVDDVGLWVGPGRGMVVDGLSISGPQPGPNGYRLGLPSTGVGIGLAAYGSGTLIDNCSVNYFHTGIKTSANNLDELCDATTVRKCTITAAVGVDFSQSNNLINEVNECVISAIIGVRASSWNGAHIRGGNYSASGLGGNVFPLTDISVASVQYGSPLHPQAAYELTITATVGSPDAFFLAGAYNAFAMKTQHYGVLPMELASWDATTGIASFVVLDAYSGAYLAGYVNDPVVHTNLVAELQASTELYAAEMITVFYGMGMHVDGVHIENGSVPTMLFAGYSGNEFESSIHNDIRNVRINGDLTNHYLGPSIIAGTASALQKAQFYVSRSWPQLRIGYAETTISDLSMDASDELFIVDFFNPYIKLNWRGAGPKLQLRTPITAYPFGTAPYPSFGGTVPQSGSVLAFGGGDYEANPFTTGLMNDADSWRSPWGKGRAPMQGYRPAPWASPTITVAQVTLLLGALPPIVAPASGPVNVGYPLLWGGQIYRLQDWYLGEQWAYQLISNHHFYTYGQPLPISWSHIGQSAFLYVSDTRLLFPGLGIEIDHGDGPQLYLVTGVYPTTGMVSVLLAVESANGPWLLHGDKSTVYTGSTIGQEPYAITRF